MRKLIFIFMVLFSIVTAFSGWEDVVIYMIMIDRFNDGDPTNNDQGFGEYHPGDPARFNGGDLLGILQKIDYIKGLGVDAIWITPPVANQWWDPWVNYGGYHGYWARNFVEVDEHFGDIEAYKKLSDELHKNGIKLIQDIVCNHVGNYFRFSGKWFYINKRSVPTSAPTQYPFNMNNYKDPKHREAAVYHWTPDIKDYKDPIQRLNYQLAGLDDLNTENPLVVSTLKESYKFWIEKVGVDGFRVDTAMYVPGTFWKEFFLSKDGIYSTKDNFIAFGEAWVTSKPMSDDGEKFIEKFYDYGFNAMLDFPLSEEIRRVIKGGQPTEYLAYRLKFRERLLEKGYLVTFIDNHDMERFLRGTSINRLKLALSFLFSIPGIPVIYYGTEQGFTETRAAMFQKGWGSGGKEHFNTESDLYKFIKELVKFRKSFKVLRNGRVEILYSDSKGAGILAFVLRNESETVLVIMNTSDRKKIGVAKTSFEPGQIFRSVFSFRNSISKITVGDGGKIVFKVPAESIAVYKLTDEKVNIRESGLYVNVDLKPNSRVQKTLRITGKTNAKKIYIYIDGNYDKPVRPQIVDGEFSFELDPTLYDPGKHVLVVKARGKTAKDVLYSDEIPFFVDLKKELLLEVNEPIGDDRGPKGTYLYPTDVTFVKQMDIKKVRIYRMGSSLIISIKPYHITTSWSPPLGFDHVTFQIFIDDPTRKGVKVLPYQNAIIPDGDWDYEIFITGWSSAIYSSEGASKNNFGKQIGSPDVLVEDGWINIVIKGEWLNFPKNYKGWKIYVTTWDYDGIENRFRPLESQPKAFRMGGGSPEDPYIMDDLMIEIEE